MYFSVRAAFVSSGGKERVAIRSVFSSSMSIFRTRSMPLVNPDPVTSRGFPGWAKGGRGSSG